MVGNNVKFWYLNEKRSTIVKLGTVLDKIIQKSNTAYIIKYMDAAQVKKITFESSKFIGKTIVELFSADIVAKVSKYLS